MSLSLALTILAFAAAAIMTVRARRETVVRLAGGKPIKGAVLSFAFFLALMLLALGLLWMQPHL